jgi:predicted deacetylase
MNERAEAVGHFVFSLDTELAWGSFDRDGYRSKHLSRDGSRERMSIEGLLDVMDEFRITGTWAIVGHLLYEQCEDCGICPILEWKGKYHAFEEVYRTENPLWYGSDIVGMILNRNAGHEIAFHGYTHRLFSKLSEAEALIEIQEWLRLARRWNITPNTVIFPQGRIGHLDSFREAGFVCFRGSEVRHPLVSVPIIGKAIGRVNASVAALTPQGYMVALDPSGLVNLPSSYWMFRTDRRIVSFLDNAKLAKLRLWPIRRGIRHAGERALVIHLWAHPHEFRTAKDFDKLRYVFDCVREEVEKGRLVSITMGDLAKRVIGE